MVGEIVELVGELIAFAFQTSGKAVLWVLGIALLIIAVVIAVESHSANECEKKGGQIVQINGNSQCVEKVKKL